jgi:hypothetical protein
MGNLRASTKKFDSSSYLGKVGSGCVYKGDRVGHALAAAKLGGHNAKMIAIKKLRRRDSKATGIGSQEKQQLKQSITQDDSDVSLDDLLERRHVLGVGDSGSFRWLGVCLLFSFDLTVQLVVQSTQIVSFLDTANMKLTMARTSTS